MMNYPRLYRFLAAILLFAVSAPLAAQDDNNRATIEMVTMEHRDPGYIRARIADRLDPRGHIGQIDRTLIIATSVGNYTALREIITGLDIPLRRLVVSVDFDYPLDGSLQSDTTSQQSVQAIENDILTFTAGPETPGLPAAEAPESQAPEFQAPEFQAPAAEEPAATDAVGLTLQAEIRDNLARTALQLENVDGFTGRYQLGLPLGEWYLINPAAEQGTGIAVRVDVLP